MILTFLILFIILQNRDNIHPRFEYLTKKTIPRPYSKVYNDDYFIPLKCMSDIQCPDGSKCYAPKPSGSQGICVVSSEMEIFQKKGS